MNRADGELTLSVTGYPRAVSRDEQRAIVEAGTILRGMVGSTVHGLHHGGQDDRDEMAIFVEPPERAA